MSEDPANAYSNAEQWVVTNVRRWIANGVLPAEIEISQAALARRLGVSRSPVRDALRRLEAQGLITIRANQRAVVTGLTVDRMREIFEMRAVLEGLAARHAVANLTETDLIELDGMARVLARLRDPEAYAAKHELFHDTVAAATGMPRLRQQLTGLRTLGTPYLRIQANAGDSAELSNDRHEDLVAVLVEGCGARAEEVFCKHVRGAFEELKPVVSRLLAAGHSEARRPEKSEGGDAAVWAEGEITRGGKQ